MGERFTHLPAELYLEISNYLSYKDLHCISRTSHYLNQVFSGILYEHASRQLKSLDTWPQREEELYENRISLRSTDDAHETENEEPVWLTDAESADGDQFETDSEQDGEGIDENDEGWEDVMDEEIEIEEDTTSDGDSEADEEEEQWHANLVASGFQTHPLFTLPQGPPLPSVHTPPTAIDDEEYEAIKRQTIEFIGVSQTAESNLWRALGESAKPHEIDRFLPVLPKWQEEGSKDVCKLLWILTEACIGLNYPLVKHLANLLGPERINHRVFSPARTWVMEAWETLAMADMMGIKEIPNYRDAEEVEDEDLGELDLGGSYPENPRLSEELERIMERMDRKKTKDKSTNTELASTDITKLADAKVDTIKPVHKPQRGIWNPILKVLLNAGLHFNISPLSTYRRQSTGPGTPLIYACYQHHLHTVRVLLANGADPNLSERFRVSNGQVHPISALSILMDTHFSNNPSPQNIPHITHWTSEIMQMLTLLAQHGANLHLPGTLSPLFALVEWSFGGTAAQTAESLVPHLLSLGVDPNHGFRPNHDISLLEWLIMEINYTTWAPSRVVALIRTVLDHGANIDHRDNVLNTPLLITCQELLNIHQGTGGVVELRDIREERARWDQMLAILPVLIEHGADPYAVGEVDDVAAHPVKVAAMMGREDIMALLLPGEEHADTRHKWLHDEAFRAEQNVRAVEAVDPEMIWGPEMEEVQMEVSVGEGGLVQVGDGMFEIQVPAGTGGLEVGQEVVVEVLGVEVVGGETGEQEGENADAGGEGEVE